MARFYVKQWADEAIGHLRTGYREGYIEAESKEDAINKLKNEGYTDDLCFVLDDYSLEWASYGSNEFEIKEIGE